MLENFLSEMLGVMTLILLGDGVVAGVLLSKTKAQNAGWIVITFAWAFAVFCGVIVAGHTGGHLNPAVTIALYLKDTSFGLDNVVAYIAGQFVGAFLGATLVFLHYYPHWAETEDKGLKLAVFCTAPAIRSPLWNLVSEIIGTFVLLLMVFMIAGPKDGSNGALPIAFVILVIGLALGPTTGYAINPARDLGPRIMHAILPIPGKGGSDWEYSWIPVVGPIVGGVVALVVWKVLVDGIILKAAA